MKFILSSILVFSCLQSTIMSQTRDINIAIISDENISENNWFEKEVKSEISDLIGSRYNLTFTDFPAFSSVDQTKKLIEQAFADSNIDVVVGTGVQVCNILAKQSNYPKPAISTIILDHELQNIPKTDEGTSGVKNFSYILSPFDLIRDVNTLYNIIPFKNVGIMGGNAIRENVLDPNAFYNKLLENQDADYTFIQLVGSVDEILNNIPEDVDAIYLFPVFDGLSDEDFKNFFDGLAAKKTSMYITFK